MASLKSIEEILNSRILPDGACDICSRCGKFLKPFEIHDCRTEQEKKEWITMMRLRCKSLGIE